MGSPLPAGHYPKAGTPVVAPAQVPAPQPQGITLMAPFPGKAKASKAKPKAKAIPAPAPVAVTDYSKPGKHEAKTQKAKGILVLQGANILAKDMAKVATDVAMA